MQQDPNEEKDEFFSAPEPQTPRNTSNTSNGSGSRSQPKPNRTRNIFTIVLAVLLAVVCFLTGWIGRYYALDEGLRTFLWAKKMTEKNYYQDIDEDELYSDMITALENQLDAYSCFYSADEYAVILKESEGENVGIGISITETDGIARIYRVIENSPAQNAGLKQAMYVTGFVAQDGTVTSGSATDLYYFISDQTGEFGLKCGYEQDGSDAQEYRMTKQSYLASYCLYRDSETSYGFRGDTALSLTETGDPIPSLPSDTAYIQLIEFNGNAATEFEQCLRVMKSRGKNNLILDLRNDGGGYLDIMRSIASHLLKNATGSSPVVATANYPKSGKTTSFYATGNDYYSYFTESSHVYLLANAGTASASECLIGAMVDYGTIAFSDIVLQGEVGSARTYGKGIMQSHFPSISGDVMKLTVATVHWPVSGKSIHGVGVTEADGARAIDTPTLEKGDSFLTGVIDLLPKTSTGSTIE